MQLIKNNYYKDSESIENLKSLKIFSTFKIKCYKYELTVGKNFFSTIVCIEVNNNKELENIWVDLVNEVAFNIQTKLDDLEIYNLYVLFFVKNDDCDYDLKHKIEIDSFSSRKLVIYNQNFDDDEKVIEILGEYLFSVDLCANQNLKNSNQDVVSKIIKDNKELEKYFNDYKEINQKNKDRKSMLLNELIEELIKNVKD